ncbi:hypothetical protein HDIA_1822 [Hartmannibacter diazotrophicus]|uniref:YicC-like family, N-terminal region n=1 Tax=Hartmannibacter diazotrophicus TaxID=1482074 RepID=A0A2C9D565_9HYPH|nr:YicC/YloC family endoribonuclease [Hartmannibacter diazotrophicus]SON55363.1 hypothetical protein HDIA_1822 [Hartmannibacter diazotrophicus]
MAEGSSAAVHPMSMTGFARRTGAFGPWRFAWELRSVNGRGLDLRIRLPQGNEPVEQAIRARLPKVLSRGSVQITLTVDRDAPQAGYAINRALLDLLVATARDYEGQGLAPATIDGLLAVRGVVEPVTEENADEEMVAAFHGELLTTFDAALADLVTSRGEEGLALAAVVLRQVGEIETLTGRAEACPARTPEAIAARIADQVAHLTGRDDLDPARLHQEAVLLAAKADIREELDRLIAHVAQARALLASGDPIGRRLDFLAQEFNRETNTLCSKSNDTELTGIGLALKAVVDQFKEQVQNFE